MTYLLPTLDPTEWVAFGFILGFVTARVIEQARSGVPGSGPALPKVVSDQPTSTVPSKTPPSATTTAPVDDEIVILDICAFLDREVGYAYELTGCAYWSSTNIDFQSALKDSLIEVGVIRLDPHREDTWLCLGKLPRFLLIDGPTLENLTAVVRRRFERVLV